MSSSLIDACRKRPRSSKNFIFHSFAHPGIPIAPTGPFRDNVRLFLQDCAEIQDYYVHNMPLWRTQLYHNRSRATVPLYTLEDGVYSSKRPFCDQCSRLGWSNHFVSKRTYHFIIPKHNKWNEPLGDVVLDVKTHLLHGMVHCNGHGHLLGISESGCASKYIHIKEFMNLWDRICTLLRTRKITVEDNLEVKSLDARLFCGVAYGRSWYGDWGYKFFRGRFGVTEQKYNAAIEYLSLLDLKQVIKHFRHTDCYKEIKKIIRVYKHMSGTKLLTMKDLLRFILNNKSHSSALCSRKSALPKKFSAGVANMDNRWPPWRLEQAAQAIVDSLIEYTDNSGSCEMTSEDLRNAAEVHIDDLDLLDEVLRSLDNVIVGWHVVWRENNPITGRIEYTLREVGNEYKARAPEPELHMDVESLSCLYKNVLLGYPNAKQVDLAAQNILNSRWFMKEWPISNNDETEQFVTFICHFRPNFGERKSYEQNRQAPPGEFVMVPLNATVGDLKRAAESALRDTYCIAEGLKVTEIKGLVGVSEDQVLSRVLKSDREVEVSGTGVDLSTSFRYHGQDRADRKVRCKCGAQDEDGERMVACDVCEVWQHTRCRGIHDSEAETQLFVCSWCCDGLES